MERPAGFHRDWLFVRRSFLRDSETNITVARGGTMRFDAHTRLQPNFMKARRNVFISTVKIVGLLSHKSLLAGLLKTSRITVCLGFVRFSR